MKKKVLSKLFVSVITASLLLSGCGAEETSGNVEGSQVEKEQETQEKIESDDIVDDNMENDESDNLSVEIDDKEPWNGVYSEKDAPGLTSIDWDLFNENMRDEQMIFLGDVDLEINILQTLGNDPRINNDWSALNEKFDTLYGNDDEGMVRFANDLARSYDYSVDFARGFCDYAYIVVEPYRTNTDNGVYGVINELEITNQAAYDEYIAKKEEESQAIRDTIEQEREQAEQERWNSLTPEEQQAELYEEELSKYKNEMSVTIAILQGDGIYTEEVWGNMETMYDVLDWLMAENYLTGPKEKYIEAIDYFGNEAKTHWK